MDVGQLPLFTKNLAKQRHTGLIKFYVRTELKNMAKLSKRDLFKGKLNTICTTDYMAKLVKSIKKTRKMK